MKFFRGLLVVISVMVFTLLQISLCVDNSIASELDEFVGDTLVVGMSELDNQHNVVIGRTIAFDPNADNGNGMAIMIFTDLESAAGYRNVRVNRIYYEEGIPTIEMESGHNVSPYHTNYRGGYATIDMAVSMDEPIPFMAYHDRETGDPWRSRAAAPFPDFPSLFVEFPVPYSGLAGVTQTKIAADGDSVIHLVAGETGEAGENRPMLYTRVAYDAMNFNFVVTNPEGEPELVTDLTTVSAGNIAASPDGQRIAIAKSLSRTQLGLYPDPSGSDMILWVNDNRGLDWDFDNSLMNLTEFQGPNPDLLPDEMAANVDTFRASTGNTMFFDQDNVLHVAFEAMPYFHYPEQTAYIFGQVYYWNEEDNLYIRIADGDFFLWAGVTSYGSMTGMPSLYKDPDTGWLWCLYQQFGEPGDTIHVEGDTLAMDAGLTSGTLNADLFITASPAGEYNGKLWFKGVNITNTKGTTGNIPAGDCRHERDGSIARNNTGDHLHISYLQDLDAGNFDNGNGTITDNPVVYQRILKQALIDSFMARQEFIPNYPLRQDSTGYWEDELGWEWRDITSVPESGDNVKPENFKLASVYPNPFNSTARIEFNLERAGAIQLKIYDILGREVVTLMNRSMNSGTHNVHFDASDISSGIYFISLESGSHKSVKKVALIR